MEDVEYRLILRDELSSALENIHGHAKRLDTEMNTASESIHKVKGAILEMIGAYAGFETIKQSMEIVHAQKMAVLDLTQVYKNNSQFTNESLESMESLAEGQEKLTGIHKEDIETLETNLLKHHNLKTSYSELIPVIEDFAKATGQNVVEAGGEFERSLTSSRGALMMLKQAGIEVNKTTIKHLQLLYNSGHAAQAQSEILAELEQRYHGVAQAMFNGDPEAQLAESMRTAQEAIGHLGEEILEDLMPTIQALIENVKSVIEWMSKHKEGLETVGKIIGVVVAGIMAYTVALKAAAAIDFLFGTSLAELAIGETAMAASTAEATEAMTALDVAMDANPIGLVAAAVVGLAAAFKTLSDNIGYAEDDYRNFYNTTAVDKGKFGALSMKEQQKQYDERVGKEVEALQKLKEDETKAKQNPDMRVSLYGSDLITKRAADAVEYDKQIISKLDKEVMDMAKVMAYKKPEPKNKISSPLTSSTPQSSSVTGQKQLIINVNIGKMIGIESSVNKHSKDDSQAAGEQVLKMLTGGVNQFAAEFDV